MKSPPEAKESAVARARQYISELAGYGILDLGAAAVLMMIVQGMLTPVLPLYLKSIGVTPDKVGYIYTFFFIALAIGEYSWGALADRIGVRMPLSTAAAIAAFATAGFLFTKSIPLLYLCNFCRGLGISAIFPLSRGNIGASVPARNRGTFMAAYITLQAGGRTIGTFFGGLAGSESLRLVLGIAAAILICSSIYVFFRLKGVFIGRSRTKTAVSPEPAAAPRTNRSLFQLFAVGAAIALFHLPLSLVNTFLPLRASAAGANVLEVGLLFTISAVVSLLLTLPMGHLGDRLGWKNAMTIGLFGLGISMTFFAYAGTYGFFVLAIIGNALSSCIFRPAASARFSDLMSQNKQATAMGVLGVFEDIGQIVGPSIGGILWESSFGPPSTFLLGAFCGVGGAVMGLMRFKGKKAAESSLAGV